jgi:hypothetical protein
MASRTFRSVFELEADTNKFRDFFGSVEVEYAALPSAFETLFISTPSNTPSRFFAVDTLRVPQNETTFKSIFEEVDPRGSETGIYRVIATVPCVKGEFVDALCVCTVDFD